MFKLLLLVQLNGPGDHPAGDSWFGVDKMKHFFMGAFVQSVSYSAVRATGVSHDAALLSASVMTMGVGIGKELWDARGGGTASARDLTWDAAGAGTATLLLRRSVR